MSKIAMQKIADAIMKFLPEDFGFIVLVFPREDSGMANYASTEEKEGIIKMLRNTVDGLEQNRDVYLGIILLW